MIECKSRCKFGLLIAATGVVAYGATYLLLVGLPFVLMALKG